MVAIKDERDGKYTKQTQDQYICGFPDVGLLYKNSKFSLPLFIYPLIRYTLGPLITCKEASLFIVTGPLDPRVVEVQLFF